MEADKAIDHQGLLERYTLLNWPEAMELARTLGLVLKMSPPQVDALGNKDDGHFYVHEDALGDEAPPWIVPFACLRDVMCFLKGYERRKIGGTISLNCLGGCGALQEGMPRDSDGWICAHCLDARKGGEGATGP